LDKSIPLLEDLLRRTEAKAGRRDYYTHIAMIGLGANYREAGRIAEATRLLEEAFGATRDHLLRRRSGAELAGAYAKAGRRRDALKLVDKLAYECRRDFPEGHGERGYWLYHFGTALAAARAPFEAETLLREAYAIRAAK